VKVVCVDVAIVDVLVPARTAASAVLSYRSVVIYGKVIVVLEDKWGKGPSAGDQRDHIMPGYAKGSRAPMTSRSHTSASSGSISSTSRRRSAITDRLRRRAEGHPSGRIAERDGPPCPDVGIQRDTSPALRRK
jgi:hypothetical protein